jgi:hypothetical protein
MQLPLTDADTLFEELLQDLPSETAQMARAFQAFVCAKKIKTPTQCMRMFLFYCGLDKTWRSASGSVGRGATRCSSPCAPVRWRQRCPRRCACWSLPAGVYKPSRGLGGPMPWFKPHITSTKVALTL